MKVGDLVRYRTTIHPYSEWSVMYGIVIALSHSVTGTLSAKVHFTNGDIRWHDLGVLECTSEAG